MMEKKAIFDRKFTVEVRNQKREELKANPNAEALSTVHAEIVKNHLMKAKMNLVPSDYSWTVFSDEPVHFGGEGSVPNMFAYFVTGMLLCETAQYVWNATELGLTDKIYKIETSIEGAFPLAPLFGLDDNRNPALTGMQFTAKIESDADPNEIEKLSKQAAARCPAHQSLTTRVPYTNRVILNGKKIAEFSD